MRALLRRLLKRTEIDPFETYYGNLLADGEDGVPTAREARRDYCRARRAIERARTYLPGR